MLSVKTEISRGMTRRLAQTGRTADSIDAGIGASLAGALGAAIRERVERQGDLAGQFAPDWDDARRPKLISSRYPDRAEGRPHRSGAELFTTSKAYHAAAGAQRGHYSVTGGMWSGLSRIVWSDRRVELRFRGRSEGQDARVSRGKSRPIKPTNALKAWTILDKHRVNVLRLHDREIAATVVGLERAIAIRVARDLPIVWSMGPGRGEDIGEIFRDAFRVRAEVPTGVAIN